MNAHARLPLARAVSRTVFLLSDRFDAVTLSAAIAPLRAANLVAGEGGFAWSFHAAQAGSVASSDGWSVEVRPLDETIWQADQVLVCGGARPDPARPSPLPDLLRRMWRMGKRVGALQGGIFTLARSGILKGRQFVVHRDQLAAFHAIWPDLDPLQDIYAVDDRILTCAGGMAATDLMLHLVQGQSGGNFRSEVMQTCMISGLRPGAVPQTGAASARVAGRNPVLLQAVQWLDDHYLEDDCVQRLAATCRISVRQLQRLFRAHLDQTPQGYIAELRLKQAALLLSQTDLDISEIAGRCGYEVTANFSKAFRKRFGVAPSRYGQRRVAPAA